MPSNSTEQSKEIKLEWVYNTSFQCTRSIENGGSRNGGSFVTEEGIIVLPELANRCAFTSTIAWAITQFFRQQKNCTRRHLLQMLHVSLLQSSVLQFHHILKLMNSQCIRKTTNLFRLYQQTCDKADLNFCNGPWSRFRGQPAKHPIFTDNNALSDSLDQLEHAVCDLDAGCFVDGKEILNKSLCNYNVKLVGVVGGISFPSLCLFLGLCSSDVAFATARQCMPNMESRNNYSRKAIDHLNQFETSAKHVVDKKMLMRFFWSIGTSWGETSATVENNCCAAFRHTPKYDVFIEGQDLYYLSTAKNVVYIRHFTRGSDNTDTNPWVPTTPRLFRFKN